MSRCEDGATTFYEGKKILAPATSTAVAQPRAGKSLLSCLQSNEMASNKLNAKHI